MDYGFLRANWFIPRWLLDTLVIRIRLFCTRIWYLERYWYRCRPGLFTPGRELNLDPLIFESWFFPPVTMTMTISDIDGRNFNSICLTFRMKTTSCCCCPTRRCQSVHSPSPLASNRTFSIFRRLWTPPHQTHSFISWESRFGRWHILRYPLSMPHIRVLEMRCR